MSKKKKQKTDRFQFGDSVLVTWLDTTGGSAWTSLHEEPIQPVTVRQLGFYLQGTKRVLHLAQGLPDQECQILGETAIPMGCVTSIRKVK